MTRSLGFAALVLLTACRTGPARQRTEPAAAEPPRLITPADVQWKDVPGSPGERVALLVGDPTRAGEYTLRRTFPAGSQTLPHWHPHAEYGTVLSGVLYVGIGEQASRANTVGVPAGGFIRLPPYTPHYTYADAPVVLQVHGPSPRQTYFVRDRPLPRR